MPDNAFIHLPAGYAPAHAAGFSGPAQELVLVSDEARLPVAVAAPAPPALKGQADASMLAGPFLAVSGRVVSVTLSGTWQGLVRLLRSAGDGAPMVPLRVAGEPWAEYTVSGCEQAWLETEDGAAFHLDIALTSGTLDYAVSQ